MGMIIHDEPDDGRPRSATTKQQFLNASSPTFLLPPSAAPFPPRPPPVTTVLTSCCLSAAEARNINPPPEQTKVKKDVSRQGSLPPPRCACDLDLHIPPVITAKESHHASSYQQYPPKQFVLKHHYHPYHHHHHHHHHHQLVALNGISPCKSSGGGLVETLDGSELLVVDDLSNMRDNYCFYRLQRFVARNPALNYLLPVCAIAVLILVIYTFRDHAKSLLYWIETQNAWVVFGIVLALFTIVAFPVTVGYLVLIISSGYLFGFLKGLLTVIIGANLGVAIAHNTIKSLQSRLPIHKLIKNETGRAILRVIAGPRAFKIVLFARLTPIPFGLQNTIFGLSAVNARSYHTGTVIGLLPAQTINVYLGSKLRSIHEVLNDHNAALGMAGYGVFVVEVIVGAALMVWVIQKARTELSAALLSDIESDEKILIEVEA